MAHRLLWRVLHLALALFIAAEVRAQQPVAAPAAERSGAASLVAGTTSMEALDTTRKLGAGDRLSYRVVEERRDPIALIVSDNGEVEVPLIGRVAARGLTCKAFAYAIRPLLLRDYFYKATVIVALDSVSVRARGHVYVSGAVRSQGALDIPADEHFTLSKAILKAGGFADFANKKKIKLIRKTAGGANQTTLVDLDAITKRGELEKDPELLPDDTIIVDEKFINF